MLFKFLRYLQPIHYFGLKTKNKALVFPVWDLLPDAVKANFSTDLNYKSQRAQDYDKSWRAITNGYIGTTETIETVKDVSVHDNYVFARKYFSVIWVFYVFIMRILSLKNPIKEIFGLYKTRSVKHYTYDKEVFNYSTYTTFKSHLIETRPLVSVIIPTLNRYRYLKDVLKDLEAQDYTNFEVLVIDQSEPFQEDFYVSYNLNISVAYQEEKALWLARNTAIKKSKGDYLLFYDDDSRVEKDWISHHLKTLDFFEVDISSGVSISKVGAEVPAHYTYFKISDQLDTGNVLIKKEVFKTIGLFDRQFEKQRMGDGEFGLRAHLSGFRNISNPYAKRLHLKVGTGGLREMGSWDAFRTSNLFQPRPIPSVLYFFRTYFGNKRALLAIIRTVPISILPYRFKKNKGLLLLGIIIAVILSPLIILQVIKSWRLATRKLSEGPMIEHLE